MDNNASSTEEQPQGKVMKKTKQTSFNKVSLLHPSKNSTKYLEKNDCIPP